MEVFIKIGAFFPYTHHIAVFPNPMEGMYFPGDWAAPG